LTMPITIWAQQHRLATNTMDLPPASKADTMFRTLSLSVATLRTVPKYRTTEIRVAQKTEVVGSQPLSSR
jgi:hypothetical protein